MLLLSQRLRAFAAASAGLAGFVDAVAFVQLGGFFVSFMSGNSTRAGVGLAFGSAHALLAAGLIVAFVCGVALGSITARLSRRVHVRTSVVVLLLTLAAALSSAGWLTAGALGLALAMGAMNAALEEGGQTRVGVTYMTGVLVKVGQRIAGIPFGESPWGWLPYLLFWAALAAGAALGAGLFRLIGTGALWVAAAWAATLALTIRAELGVEVTPAPTRLDPPSTP